MKKMMLATAAMMALLGGQVAINVAEAGKYGGSSFRSYSRPSYSTYKPRTNFTGSRAARPAPAAAPVKPMNPVAKPLQQKPPAVAQKTPPTNTVRHTETRTVEQSSGWSSWMPLWLVAMWSGSNAGSGAPAPSAKECPKGTVLQKDGSCKAAK